MKTKQGAQLPTNKRREEASTTNKSVSKQRLQWFAAAGAAVVGFASVAQAELAAVGPVNPDNGYPIYYEDANGLQLAQCLKENGLCLLELPTPGAPVSFPDNFPDESFYWTGEATLTTAGGGDGLLVLALEAAWFNEVVVDGDQVVFGRVRFRIDNLSAGETYTITTPFGVFTEVAAAAGRRGINFTEDVGLVEGDFTAVLTAKVGPFLTPPGFDPDNPTVTDAEGVGYIADPNVATTVTGSTFLSNAPFGGGPGPAVNPANFFRIEGPGVGNQAGLAASPDRCASAALGPVGNRSDCVETNIFNISGQIASVFGVQPVRTTYTRFANDNGRIDVLATSVPFQAIELSVPRNNGNPRITPLFEDPLGSGRYFGRVGFNTATGPNAVNLPNEVTLTNTTDTPPTVVTSPLVDTVTVTQAAFNTTDLVANGEGTLTLRVNSSDNGTTPPLLQAMNTFGTALECTDGTITGTALPDNVQVTCDVFAVGEITVESGAGGTATQDVVISGPNVSGP